MEIAGSAIQKAENYSNPPNVQEEDDEKQQKIEEDDNNQENEPESELEPVDNEGDKAKDDLSDLEDIFESRENVNDKADQNYNLDNMEEFLERFDDEELEGFL